MVRGPAAVELADRMAADGLRRAVFRTRRCALTGWPLEAPVAIL
jgi:hypothetical protein